MVPSLLNYFDFSFNFLFCLKLEVEVLKLYDSMVSNLELTM